MRTTAPDHPRHRLTAVLMALMLVMGLLASPVPGPQGAAAEEAGSASVEAALTEQLAERDEATFWVILKAQADLAGAANVGSWTERGEYVHDRLTSTATQSQDGLRDFLTERRVHFEPFWIVNTILVTGNQALVDEIAARPEVAEIRLERTFQIPEPDPGRDENTINALEWGVERINANDVWDTFGVRGEGIVVANIDTGVQFDHPAVVDSYRGNAGGGVFDHNYNWFDPSSVCGSPSLVPCDNNGHGTHTMGTMVGDDGGANQIGVAPGATWIAAKGCESTGCSESALLGSGQWVLAPTDLAGQNPDPSKRPHIVNNSWGNDNGGDTFYQATVQAWVAAGMFPTFSNGNAGPACGTVGAPASYPESFGVGGFDINDNVYTSSSRGPSPASVGGLIKPQVSAPAVNVRSSVLGNGYANFTGTSMAAPHLSGTVALMWSAAPAIVGDLPQTMALLGDTAIDTDDTTCGGTPENNNVWGEGRLDAFAAVDAAPKGPTGILAGTVTDSSTSAPIAGAQIAITGDAERVTSTGADGTYQVTLPAGTFDVSAASFGYVTQTAADVVVSQDATTTQDFALVAASTWTVSGTVRDDGGDPVSGATVTIAGTPFPPVVTGADGTYAFNDVPEGTYTATASAGGCLAGQSQELVVAGDTTLDFDLPRLVDDFGYFCDVVPADYIEGDTPLGLSGLDANIEHELPFSFPLYGTFYDTAWISTKAYLNFLTGNNVFTNTAIPNTAAPNAAVYAFWDDLNVDTAASTWTKLIGEAPNRQYVIEWRNVSFFADTTRRVDVEMVLLESGNVLLQYRNIAADGREQGNSATIGLENATGTGAHQYSFNQASVSSPEFALLYQLPPSGVVQGTVTDANDGDPIAGAEVSASAGGEVVRETTTGGDGSYLMQLPLGTYTVEAAKTNYETGSESVTLDTTGEFVTVDFSLRTARAELDPTSIELIVPPDQTRTRTVTLSNTGGLDLVWESSESGGGSVSSIAGMNATGAEPMRVPADVTPLSAAHPTSGRIAGSDPTAVPNAPPWEDIAAYPFAVMDHLADSFDGVVYSVSGIDGTLTWRNNVISYDPGTGAWTQLSPIPTARERPNGAIIDGQFYVVGGWDSSGAVVPSMEIYDIASDSWSAGTPIPEAWAASSNVVLDGRLYLIGGCQDACGTTDVWVYDPGADAWAEAAPYPEPISWAHCGAIGERIYCAGGSAAASTDNAYAYDPAANAWSPIAPMPQDQWAGSYVAANDLLLVSGGVTDGFATITNEGFAYDPATDSWSPLANSNNLLYRGVGACGFYRIGGSTGGFTPNAASEVLPGFDTCGEAGDIPWLTSAPTSGTLAPGETQEVELTIDTAGLEPGIYQGRLSFATNSGRQPRVSVSIRLIVPAYQQGVNAGGNAYVDAAGDTWSDDQAYSAGGWGYTQGGQTPSTNRQIADTDDDPLYQRARRDPGSYRFDGLPDGTYVVELRFAEIQRFRPGLRVFDVRADGEFLLSSYDIAEEVGSYTADDYSFTVVVTGGTLEIVFEARRGQQPPLVSALRITERPDQ